ncbi:MAG: hypothetical protein Fur0010_27400 [Bdellovibrio sp.]
MDRADNIVTFPIGHYAPEFVPEELGADPLEDLLNEFNDYFDDDLWDEKEEELTTEKVELSANKIKELDTLALNQLLKQQMTDLEEMSLRLNYYLGEIELYLPEKRRK